jgi:hypothetical protein
MADFGTDFNIQSIKIEPYVLIDEVSSTSYYIGTSRSFSAQGVANWRIKKIWKVGNVWRSAFPGGDQGFTFIWTDRGTYTYQ